MRKLDSVKVERYMRYVFILLTGLAAIYNFYNRQWEVFFLSIITLILFGLPSLFIKRTNIKIPAAFQIVILLFIFASMYLGESEITFIKSAGGTPCCMRLPPLF